MSMTDDGRARRRFIKVIKDWPPAISFASASCASSSRASATESGLW